MTERQTVGPSREVERNGNTLYRDTRPHLVRLFEALKSDASGFVLVGGAVAVGIEPAFAVPAMAASVLFSGWVLTRRVVLPLRLPKHAKRLDYNHPDPENRKPRMSEGIIHLGQDYRTRQQLWLANEDGRQHVAVPGTTGAGKTSALLSLCVNPLSWGSGFIFVDGKADNRLFANVLALARRYGREDDVLALNFLVASGSKHSATFNPFAWGNENVIRELLVSQIESNPNGGDKGGNHIFMQRAVALLGALTPALVWMRDFKGVPIDIESIRFATELESIVSLVKDRVFLRRNTTGGDPIAIAVPEISEDLIYPLRAYLGETGKYDVTQPVHKQKSDEPARQHSFVVMHFSATFTQLAVSLGHIFKCEMGDIDMRDVVLNRRILIVNLPTLENSGETTAALGKLVVASLRNMMAQTLGVDLEGDFAEIVENKPHLSPTPFPVVFDEIGYYVVPGMDKMLAMGRGLGFMFLLGFQEVAGLRARIGDTMYSLLGNANVQILMRLQEGSETRKYIEQTAGDTHVTQASSFQSNLGGDFHEAPHAEVRQVSRVNWSDLRSLIEGEAIIVFGKDRVYAKLFYAHLDPRGAMRLNRPIVLPLPEIGRLKEEHRRSSTAADALVKGRAAGRVETSSSPTLEALIAGLARTVPVQDNRPLADKSREALLGLLDVVPDQDSGEAVSTTLRPSVETEHSAPMEHVSSAADNPPLPEKAKRGGPPGRQQALAEIAVASGASQGEAFGEAEQVAAMVEEAGSERPHGSASDLNVEQFCNHLRVVIEGAERLAPRQLPSLAAE